MNEYDVAAIIDTARLKIWQWRKIHQGIRYFMDLPKVSVEEKRMRRLGADCGLITHGSYHYSDPDNPDKVKELIRYWTKDPVVELLQSLQGIINGYALHPSDIKYIHVVQSVGIDGEVRAIMLQRADDSETKAKVNTICDDVGLALKLWDGAFADIHSSDTSDEHCDLTQERIKMAMEQLRFMKIPITPKMHGMECHVVDQMRNILGGIGKLMEHWMEQYHQIGYRFDMAYCRAGSLKGQADIRSSAEKRGRNPRVQMCKKMLSERYEGTRKRRKSAIENEEKEIRVKEERRDGALTEITHKIAQRDIMSLDKEIQECEEELDELEDLEDREKLETEIFGEEDGNNE
jgi:hypothetical protein